MLERIWRAVLHAPIGAIIIFVASPPRGDWFYGFAILALFIFYEKNEDKWLRDRAWIDVFGAICGAVIYAILLKVGVVYGM